GGSIDQGGALGDDGVEPIAELARKAFGDQVGRIPLLPVGAGVAGGGGGGRGGGGGGAGGGARPCGGGGGGAGGGGSILAVASQLGHLMLTASIQGRWGEWPSNSSQPSTARSLSSVSLPMTSKVPHCWHS